MSNVDQLLSELFRPRQLDDLALPRKVLAALLRMSTTGKIMNLAFYGRPGTGKTTAARILGRTPNLDCIEVNGSSANGIDFVRDRIERFAHSGSVYGHRKLCLIDEADGLTKPAQMALRYIIENSSENCRFIFTANELKKLTPGIQSRLQLVCFDLIADDVEEVLSRLWERYVQILAELGIQSESTRVKEIVALHFPDFRAIANQLEYEFGNVAEVVA